MKHRLTYFAAVAVLADALALGAIWQAGPALSLTAALAVPAAEPLLAPLYTEPLHDSVAIDVEGATFRGELYRPQRPRSAVVLIRDAADAAPEAAQLARVLARRDIAVVTTDAGAALAPAMAYARMLGVPVRVESVTTFRQAEAPASVVTRAAYAVRLLRLATTLVTAR